MDQRGVIGSELENIPDQHREILDGSRTLYHASATWSTPAGYANRSTENGAGSMNGVSPVIISASSRPDTGPSVSP